MGRPSQLTDARQEERPGGAQPEGSVVRAVFEPEALHGGRREAASKEAQNEDQGSQAASSRSRSEKQTDGGKAKDGLMSGRTELAGHSGQNVFADYRPLPTNPEEAVVIQLQLLGRQP